MPSEQSNQSVSQGITKPCVYCKKPVWCNWSDCQLSHNCTSGKCWLTNRRNG